MKIDNKLCKIIRWGIIGCGKVTEIKSGPPYYLVEGFELSAVMRRDKNKVIDYAKRHSVKKYYTSADDLINDNEIDAVYIATPPDSHKHYAFKVAEAGKPCCIEKPLASNYIDSIAISEVFKNKNLPLFVAYYRRSLPRFNEIKEWLDNGYIGEVRHVNWHLSKPTSELDLSKAYNWRTDNKVATGGYFDDLASHGIDLFVYFLGEIKEVKGISVNQQGLYSSKDAISASWLHKCGATGSGSWNFGCSLREDRVEIYGSEGKITFSVFDEKELELKTNLAEKKISIENPVNIQFYHVENIKKHLLEKIKHPSNGTSATHTSWVMDKILGKI